MGKGRDKQRRRKKKIAKKEANRQAPENTQTAKPIPKLKTRKSEAA